MSHQFPNTQTEPTGAPDLRALALIAGDVNVRGCIQFIQDTSDDHFCLLLLLFLFFSSSDSVRDERDKDLIPTHLRNPFYVRDVKLGSGPHKLTN